MYWVFFGRTYVCVSYYELVWEGFPGSSAGKESTCNAGDSGSIPGSGRSLGVGIGYPLQYSWASLVAQTVKNPPVMRETWVRSLRWEDPLEEGMVTHSSILAWRIPWTEEPGGLQCMVLDKVKVKVTQLCPTLCDPMDCTGQNTGVGSLSLLQGIFLI